MSPSPDDLHKRTATGILWQALGVGGQRLVQLAGFAVLARLLPEAEIGTFGVLLAAIAAIEALTFFAGEQSQIHSRRGHERAYLDTVFTVRLLRAVVISTVLALLSPVFAWFFRDSAAPGEHSLTVLFLLLAFTGLLDAVQSPARASRIKELDFRRVSLGDFSAAVLGTTATIAMAFAWGDVRALVAGHLCGVLLRSAISYAVAPYRPRLSFDRSVGKELGRYALGAAGAPFLLVMIFCAPALILGKLAAPAAVAIYGYGEKLAKIPEDLFLRVLGPVALPAYSQLASDQTRLRQTWLRAVRAFMLVGAPLATVFAWIGSDLPALVYGETYGQHAWLFPLLAVHGGLAGLTAVIGPLFWAIGEPEKDRTAQLCRMLTLYGAGTLGVWLYGVEGCAAAAVLSIAAALVVSLSYACRRLGVAAGAVLGAMRSGTLAAVLVLLPLLLLDLVWRPAGLLRCTIGAAVGGPTVLLLALRAMRRRSTASAAPLVAPPVGLAVAAAPLEESVAGLPSVGRDI